MEDVSANEGRTVLFVSHNMQAVRHLCSIALLLEGGALACDGPVAAVITSYLSSFGSNDKMILDRIVAGRNGWIESVCFVNESDQHILSYSRGELLRVKIVCNFKAKVKSLEMSMAVLHGEGTPLFSSSILDQYDVVSLEAGRYLFTFYLPTDFLKFESYALTV